MKNGVEEEVYHWLKFELNLRTAAGNKNSTLGNIYMLLQNHFYYGILNIQRKVGIGIQEKHEPIITKELFDAVQTQIKSQFVRSGK